MKGLKLWTLIAYLSVIGLVPANLAYGSEHSQNKENTALFGTVSEIQIHEGEQANILLQTVDISVPLLLSRDTQLNMPGKTHVSLDQILIGDNLAVVVKTENNSFKALQLLVKPTNPVTVKHLTGVVVSQENGALTFIDSAGNSLLLELSKGTPSPNSGDTVTLIIKQDFQTDRMTISGISSANKTINTLDIAIDKAIKSNNSSLTNILQQRLTDAITSHLTILQKALNHTSSRLSFYSSKSITEIHESFKTSISSSNTILEHFDLGRPEIKLVGTITGVNLVDSQNGDLLITPSNENLVEGISFSKNTNITFRGEIVQLSAQNLGNLTTILYDANTYEASTIKLQVPDIRAQSLEPMLKNAFQDEIEGTVAAITLDVAPPLVTISTAEGGFVNLKAPDSSVVIVDDNQVALSKLGLRSQVKILVDTLTNNILEISTFKTSSGEQPISGIVNNVIEKLNTITIVTPNSKITELSLTADTVIVRNGKIMPLAQIRVGDIVRPTTIFEQNTGKLIKLSLKNLRPLHFTGIIRGLTESKHRNQLAIFSDHGNALQLNLTKATPLQHRNQVILFEDLEIGDRISGQYDPVTMDIFQIFKQPHRIKTINGMLRSKDAFLFSISVQPTAGDPIIMAITGGTQIILDGKSGRTFQDIKVGDTVNQAFYQTTDLTATRLIVTSQ